MRIAERDEVCWRIKIEVCYSDREVREASLIKYTFEQRPERREEIMHSSGRIPGRGESNCKGPKIRVCLVCSRRSKGDSVVEAEDGRGHWVKIMRAIVGHWKDFGFCSEWIEDSGEGFEQRWGIVWFKDCKDPAGCTRRGDPRGQGRKPGARKGGWCSSTLVKWRRWCLAPGWW